MLGCLSIRQQWDNLRMIVQPVRTGPSTIVQILWFIVIGWWFSALWTILAGLFSTSILLLPISIIMLNKIPQIVALREPRKSLVVVGNALMEVKVPQRSFILRAIYFFVIGWWLTWIWIAIAWLLCVIIIGMPLGFIMFDLTPTIQTLRRRASNLMVAPAMSQQQEQRQEQQQEQSVTVNVNVQNVINTNNSDDSPSDHAAEASEKTKVG